VILAQSDEQQAHAKAAALAAAIAGAPLRWEGLMIALSAAYGVYAFSGPTTRSMRSKRPTARCISKSAPPFTPDLDPLSGDDVGQQLAFRFSRSGL